MIDIQIRIQGDKIILEGLNQISKEIPGAIKSGLEKSAKGIHRAAYNFLSGPGAKGRTTGELIKHGKPGKLSKQKWTPQTIPAGGYPVPVRTGHLRRMLDWLKPGQSKTGEAGTFSAGPHEVVIYDSAIYANVVHEGRWTQSRHGPRRYLTDAFEMFNRGEGIRKTIEDEIQKAKSKAGLR